MQSFICWQHAVVLWLSLWTTDHYLTSAINWSCSTQEKNHMSPLHSAGVGPTPHVMYSTQCISPSRVKVHGPQKEMKLGHWEHAHTAWTLCSRFSHLNSMPFLGKSGKARMCLRTNCNFDSKSEVIFKVTMWTEHFSLIAFSSRRTSSFFFFFFFDF